MVLVELLWRGGRKQNSKSFECFHGVKFLIPFRDLKGKKSANCRGKLTTSDHECVCVYVCTQWAPPPLQLLAVYGRKKQASSGFLGELLLGMDELKVNAITQFWMNHKWVFTLVTYPVLFLLTPSSVKGIKGPASPNV